MKNFNNLNFIPYGFSHSEVIGFKLNGVPPGFIIDFSQIDQLLVKRKGEKTVNTSRIETEKLILKSGFTDDVTNGEEINIEIIQKNYNSNDYQFGVIRSGHADLSAYQKYGSDYQFQGGGQFSGRMTILYVIAGEIAGQILNKITTTQAVAHIFQVGDFKDESPCFKQLLTIQEQVFPFYNLDIKIASLELIKKLRNEGNSVGGKIRILINVEKNYGGDFFSNLESKISALLFAIPGVKAIEFGLGVDFASKKGFDVIEQLQVVDGELVQKTNYNGGINGGIANGICPIEVILTFKPTSSVFKQYDTVKWNEDKLENITYKLQGRHDSFIANRGIWPALGLLNLLFLDLEMEEYVN